MTAILFGLAEADGEMRATSRVSGCPCCKGRSATVNVIAQEDQPGPAMKSASHKILYFGISVFRLWFKPLM